MSSKKAHIYQPPNTLMDKIGGPLPNSNPEAIARAEANVESMSDQFEGWLVSDIDRLGAAEKAWLDGGKKHAMDDIHTVAIDLKGLAQTYGFPLISRLAGSLACLTSPEWKDQREEKIVRAHTDAIRAAIRDNIKKVDHQVGVALVEELERKTLGTSG